MGRTVVIDPVTRVEGRARVTVELDDAGRVAGARVQVLELRGFEALCAGRPLREMGPLTARICGICPASHSLAAARAGDAVLGAEPPPAARRLRALVQVAQVIQSHALSFFYLSGPDLVLGHDGDPARRTILGLAEAAPALARDGVRLRRFGQEVIERVAGRRVHAAYAIPGGVARPLEAAARDAIAADLPAALEAAERTLAWWEAAEGGHADEAEGSRLETAFLCLAGPAGELSVDGGLLRVVAPSGERIADEVDPAAYADLIDEESEPWTYLRPARLRGAAGDGAFRVGPLARLNAVARCGTPRADRALARFRALAPGPVPSTFHAHRARLVEILWGLEHIAELLSEPALLDREVLAPPGEGRPEGVGACEAPRGTLIHHYRVDADGLVAWANLVVPTAENGRAMERAVLRIADRWLSGARITPALLNRVEAGIRAFDPCLSCSTHAVGERSVALRLVGPGGRVLDEAGSD